ncbi:uncharacterized protein [Lepisosteus oculatus]|uniref:uncharacterized protein isoform X3 n=1 Tax=Lepisosteus oculatus TaxID=7918 RepID=UPI00074014C1|nr:PREDICTED: uncharacterized protein LOC107077978 isoform X3 [Lepisosteus oculatus]
MDSGSESVISWDMDEGIQNEKAACSSVSDQNTEKQQTSLNQTRSSSSIDLISALQQVEGSLLNSVVQPFHCTGNLDSCEGSKGLKNVIQNHGNSLLSNSKHQKMETHNDINTCIASLDQVQEETTSDVCAKNTKMPLSTTSVYNGHEYLFMAKSNGNESHPKNLCEQKSKGNKLLRTIGIMRRENLRPNKRTAGASEQSQGAENRESEKKTAEDQIFGKVCYSDEGFKMVIHQFWRKVFGILRVPLYFIMIFLIEMLDFVSQSLCNVLVVGIMTALGDHVIKPLLVVLFSHAFQPMMIFLLNVSSSVRDLFNPFFDMLRVTMQRIAVIVKAFRIVEINKTSTSTYLEDV